MRAEPGEIISYLQMCSLEGRSLQQGMNFHISPQYSVILMSVRKGAPYNDRIEDEGWVIIYEGHDRRTKSGEPDPKTVDQPFTFARGSLTQNGIFFEAAHRFKNGEQGAEYVRVYEKIKNGIWVYNGMFQLLDAWQENDGKRNVYKFKLRLAGESVEDLQTDNIPLEHSRVIPTSVKLEVWKRDQGRCIICGSEKNLHFDHIIPFSKGGTSLTRENIQLLCAAHNLAKKDKIE